MAYSAIPTIFSGATNETVAKVNVIALNNNVCFAAIQVNRTDSYYKVDIYKSTDGGQTWAYAFTPTGYANIGLHWNLTGKGDYGMFVFSRQTAGSYYRFRSDGTYDTTPLAGATDKYVPAIAVDYNTPSTVHTVWFQNNTASLFYSYYDFLTSSWSTTTFIGTSSAASASLRSASNGTLMYTNNVDDGSGGTNYDTRRRSAAGFWSSNNTYYGDPAGADNAGNIWIASPALSGQHWYRTNDGGSTVVDTGNYIDDSNNSFPIECFSLFNGTDIYLYDVGTTNYSNQPIHSVQYSLSPTPGYTNQTTTVGSPTSYRTYSLAAPAFQANNKRLVLYANQATSTSGITVGGYIEVLNSPPNAPALSGPTWSNGSFTVNWTFSDPDAGNTQSAMQVQVGSDSAFTTIISDSGKTTQTTGSYALNFTSEGPKYCRVRVWDNVDSVSGWSNTVTVNVDRTAPVIGSASPLQYANAFNTSVAFQAITVSDDWSGIDHVTFSFYNPSNSLVSSANGTQSGTTWSKTFTGVTNAEGQWRADIVAYDTAGNASAAQSAYLIVDVTPPVIGSGDGNRYSSQTSGTIRHDIYSVSDTTSGMQKVTVSYRKSVNNGSTWGAYTGPVNATASAGTWYYDVPITGDGYYQVDFTAYDNAGNVRPVYTMFTTVDGTLAADPSLPIAQADIGRTTATFRWSAFSDPVPSSGYNHTSFWLGQWDGTNWVGGSPNLYNGAVVTSNGATLSYAVTGLLEGVRYRYTVAHFDNAGNQSGFTWREFYTKKKIGEFHVGSKTNTALAVPVYDPQTIPYSAARIEANGIVGCFELVDTTATNASPERVATPYGIKSIAT